LVEGLFSASATSQAFEGGNSDCGEKSHDANNGKEFDEGEGRYGPGRDEGVKGGRG
jgi:hypothetical protein